MSNAGVRGSLGRTPSSPKTQPGPPPGPRGSSGTQTSPPKKRLEMALSGSACCGGSRQVIICFGLSGKTQGPRKPRRKEIFGGLQVMTNQWPHQLRPVPRARPNLSLGRIPPHPRPPLPSARAPCNGAGLRTSCCWAGKTLFGGASHSGFGHPTPTHPHPVPHPRPSVRCLPSPPHKGPGRPIITAEAPQPPPPPYPHTGTNPTSSVPGGSSAHAHKHGHAPRTSRLPSPRIQTIG